MACKAWERFRPLAVPPLIFLPWNPNTPAVTPQSPSYHLEEQDGANKTVLLLPAQLLRYGYTIICPLHNVVYNLMVAFKWNFRIILNNFFVDTNSNKFKCEQREPCQCPTAEPAPTRWSRTTGRTISNSASQTLSDPHCHACYCRQVLELCYEWRRPVAAAALSESTVPGM